MLLFARMENSYKIVNVFLIKGSLADYHLCDLLRAHSKPFGREAVICHLQLVHYSMARLFLMFQEVSLPDSSFHFVFPLDFWRFRSFLCCNVLFEYPVNKNLCFLAGSLTLKLSYRKLTVSIC